MKPKNWRQTKQHGVNVWPSASIWMREGVMFSFEFCTSQEKIVPEMTSYNVT